MQTLICNMCGGRITITGDKTYGICDSCGSEVTFPKIDDDKRVELYNRGNYFRRKGDFDKAYSAYQHIIANDEYDAEAYWCLTLCRYGVEYVLDSRKGEYKPTINRMCYDSILKDPDYLKALEKSDENTKEIYKKEANKISAIQDKYRDIYNNEPPYDVFICFKAEEQDGQRTKGSVIAQDIYTELTKYGLNVFFSRITLADKLGEDYEPYIFAALHSAKVMLLVADKPEHLQTRWVKNEWSRFLNMMERDGSKSLIPVYINMSPYDFPEEIPIGQGQDMVRVGAMQDLVHGVLKLTGKQTNSTTVIGQKQMTENLMKRLVDTVEDGGFEDAQELAKRILDYEPKNGEAYYYLFLAANHAKNCEELLESGYDWPSKPYFKIALEYGTDDRKKVLKKLEEKCAQKKKYNQAKQWFRAGKKQMAVDAFKQLGDYEDSATLKVLCQKALEAEQLYDQAQNEYQQLEQKRTEMNSKLSGNETLKLLISVLVFGASVVIWYIDNQFDLYAVLISDNVDAYLKGVPLDGIYIISTLILAFGLSLAIQCFMDSYGLIKTIILTILFIYLSGKLLRIRTKYLPDVPVYGILAIAVAMFFLWSIRGVIAASRYNKVSSQTEQCKERMHYWANTLRIKESEVMGYCK